MCERGTLLDGFPRTEVQAAKLDEMFKHRKARIDNVIELKVDEALLEERITGRRIHQESGRSYHVKFNPPKVEGIDDVTGEPLMQRKDDTAEALKKRMASYHEQTTPVYSYYAKHGLLSTIDASQKIPEVRKSIDDSIYSKMH